LIASGAGCEGISLRGASMRRKIGPTDRVSEECRLILILIKAHSRNSVAGIQIAKFVQSTYGDTHIPPVYVELAAFDPVPGPVQSKEYRETKLETMAQSTIVYSAATQYSVGFDPQRVYGAKRVIISSKNHGVGYPDGVIFQGSLYKGSRISSLPEGFYIGSPAAEGMAEKISRCTSVAEVEEFLRQNYSYTQKDRQKIIVKVAKVFFGETTEKKGFFGKKGYKAYS
jgi:hypothetical protein